GNAPSGSDRQTLESTLVLKRSRRPGLESKDSDGGSVGDRDSNFSAADLNFPQGMEGVPAPR
ncbi:MAG: hypothetical protein KAJ78_07215, partial [Acidobacteria bacterium]|nr:hypothetical protein [Acidobacteriota bacterium]